MGSRKVQWCNLPKDMVVMVAKRLDSRTEILRLRAVCSSWRSSLPPSPNMSALFSVKFPFPIAEPIICYLEPCNSDNPDHASSASSPKGWMVRVGEDSSGKMRILDAFSEKFPLRSEVINLLQIRVSEVAKVCSFRHPNFVNKVALSSSSSSMMIPSSDCAMLTIGIDKKLWYFKLGDKNLKMVDDGQGESSDDYKDILYHEGKFFAVDAGGKMIVIDSSLNVKVIESPVPHHAFYYGEEHKFLVESNKNVYLVDVYLHDEDDDYLFLLDHYIGTKVVSYDLIHMDVYKLNEEEKGWVQVTNLGDEAFFVGGGCCFSVSATEISGCKGNCIYFRNKPFNPRYDDLRGDNICMFDLEDQRGRPLSSFEGYSQIFWPPPTWLKLEVAVESSSSRCSM